MKDKPVILVVDDQLPNIELLEAYLVSQGYEIVQAVSGEEALDKLVHNQIDLILLDILMPKMSGLEVLEKLRANEKTRAIPVVMVTALKDTEDKVKALEAGCDDFIFKPFDKVELLVRIKSLLRIKFLYDEVDAAREYFENIINTVREPMLALDQDLRVVKVSRSFYEFFKVKPEETVGQLIYDLGNKQWDIPKLRELLETILPQKTTFDNYEVEHDFAVIGRRIMLLNARQIERVLGKERIILLAIEDITERKQQEENKYKTIIHTSIDGFWLADLQGNIIEVNDSYCKMVGYSCEELLKMKISDIDVNEKPEDIQAHIRKLKENGSDCFETRHKCKEGSIIDVVISASYLKSVDQMFVFVRDITERKKMVENIKNSQKLLQKIINLLPIRVFWKDKDLRYLGCNEVFAKDAGKNQPEDLIGKDDFQMAWKGQAKAYQADDQGVIKSGKAKLNYEEPEITPKGDKIWLKTSKVPLIDSQGNEIGILGTYEDITERKLTEEQFEKTLWQNQHINALQQLLLAPASLENKLKSITDGIVRIFDADFCRIWMIKPGDLCEKGCMHAEVKEGPHVCRFRDKCLHLLASSGRYTHIDGKGHARIPFGCYKIGLIASEGEKHKFLTNDAVNDPRVHNYEWARELGLVSFAGYQLKIPGIETIGVMALFSKHPIRPAEDAILDSLSATTALVAEETIAADATRRQALQLEVSLKETLESRKILTNMLDDNNQVRERLEKSLEELRNTQAQLIQAEKLDVIGRMASGVAHEVKNPLGIILQGINYMENRALGKEEGIGEVLQMMKDGIGRADKIINGLLNFSKSTTLEFTLVDIDDVLENSILLLQVPTRFPGVQIVKEVEKRIPKVKIDRNRMEQVFINIITNAAQAMDNKGKIAIRSYVKEFERLEEPRSGKSVDYFNLGEKVLIVEIEDTGAGIPQENLSKIFDAFFTTKGPRGGAGLGLGICLNIIDMHKGLIDVESQVGKGSKISITLKLTTEGENG